MRSWTSTKGSRTLIIVIIVMIEITWSWSPILPLFRRLHHVAGVYHLLEAERVRTHVKLAEELDKSPEGSCLTFAIDSLDMDVHACKCGGPAVYPIGFLASAPIL